jgi:F-box protein 11
MNKYPIGFMSYVRFNDEHDHGRLTEFRKRLSGEVQVHTGELFQIFQDRNDIDWGQQWRSRIDDCLDHGTFLIPIITPSFFKSDACRAELERFLSRESELGRDDLILPLYYVNCPVLNDASRRKDDPLAKTIGERNYVDWRELRYEPLSSPQSAKMMAKLAVRIAEALESRVPEQFRTNLPLATQPCGKQETSGAKPVKGNHAGRNTEAIPPVRTAWTATQARLWPDLAPPAGPKPVRAVASPILSDSAGQGGKSVFEI